MAVDLANVVAILKIILFDLVLSGDNAVVIGLAAHRLPPQQRKRAMVWGCGLAIVMRIGLTLIVSLLLVFPCLRFTGGILLAWIACKLMLEEVQAADDPTAAPSSLFKAIQRIAMADFIMSLDNVLAIASAAQSWNQIIVGLILSIMMLLFLSAVITEIMSRYRWIAYAGAALLAWTAADMMAHDLHEFFHAGYVPGWPEFPWWGDWALRAFLVLMCLTINWWLPGARHKPADPAAPTDADAGAATTESPVEHATES